MNSKNKLLKTALLAIAAILILSESLSAQVSFGYSNLPIIQKQNNSGNYVPLLNPWQGGLNNPQPNLIDLNLDGQLDLAVFDRGSRRVSCYLRSGSGTNATFTYQPYYSSLFPKMHDWMILKDADCDGKPDLFTTMLNNIVPRLFKNIGTASGPRFQIRDTMLMTTTFSGRRTPLILNTADFPHIADMDNDGDLDFICQEFTGVGYELHLNTAIDTGVGNPCNFSSFTKSTNCFGSIASTFTCGLYQQMNCRTGADRTETPPGGRVAHSGATLNFADVNGDNKPDFLAGDIGCSSLYVLPNISTSGGYTFSSTPLPTFPNATNPAATQDYPASFVMDVDGDNINDLLVAPNSPLNNNNYSTFQTSFLFYRNQGTNTNPNFQLQANDFLQNTTLDLGYDARPAVGDVDGDGLNDILIGNGGFRNTRGSTSSIAFLKNVGTSTSPTFRLITTDWLSLSSRNRTSLQPELIDLNLDGALDLVLGYDSGQGNHQVIYFLNTNAAGAVLSFNLNQFNPLNGPNWLPFDSPAFTDIDQDGKLDMLVGRYNATLLYYRNIGTNNNPTYTLQNSNYLGVNFVNQGIYDLNIWVTDIDADSRQDLVSVDSDGNLRIYENIQNRGTDSLIPVTKFMREYLQMNAEAVPLGARAHPAMGDFNNDGLPEMVLGQSSGGLTFLWNTLRNTPTGSINPLAIKKQLVITPNPAEKAINLQISKPSQVQIIDARGALVLTCELSIGIQEINVESLSSGCYQIQLIEPNGQIASGRFIKQ